MKKIEIIDVDLPVVKRYRVPTVSQALGISEGSITGYFSNRGITTKGGITLDQVEEFLRNNRYRDSGAIDWNDVDDLISRLAERGFVVTEA